MKVSASSSLGFASLALLSSSVGGSPIPASHSPVIPQSPDPRSPRPPMVQRFSGRRKHARDLGSGPLADASLSASAPSLGLGFLGADAQVSSNGAIKGRVDANFDTNGVLPDVQSVFTPIKDAAGNIIGLLPISPGQLLPNGGGLPLLNGLPLPRPFPVSGNLPVPFPGGQFPAGSPSFQTPNLSVPPNTPAIPGQVYGSIPNLAGQLQSKIPGASSLADIDGDEGDDEGKGKVAALQVKPSGALGLSPALNVELDDKGCPKFPPPLSSDIVVAGSCVPNLADFAAPAVKKVSLSKRAFAVPPPEIVLDDSQLAVPPGLSQTALTTPPDAGSNPTHQGDSHDEYYYDGGDYDADCEADCDDDETSSK